jgi:hypothetical protein
MLQCCWGRTYRLFDVSFTVFSLLYSLFSLFLLLSTLLSPLSYWHDKSCNARNTFVSFPSALFPPLFFLLPIVLFLRYAHENGCAWDETTCSSAALEGHLECLKYDIFYSRLFLFLLILFFLPPCLFHISYSSLFTFFFFLPFCLLDMHTKMDVNGINIHAAMQQREDILKYYSISLSPSRLSLSSFLLFYLLPYSC